MNNCIRLKHVARNRTMLHIWCTFMNERNLREHLYIHNDNVTSVLQTFKGLKTSLKRHEVSHTNGRLYKCDQCDR